MPLRTADVKNTKRFEDGDAWIELRTGGLTKYEADQIRELTANFRIDPDALNDRSGVSAKLEIDQRVADANRALFGILCSAWSLDEPPSGESYMKLDQESGEWIEACIGEILMERRERAEGKAPKPSAAKPRRQGGTSKRAAAST